MVEYRVEGAEKLEALAKKLKAEGRGDLRKELLRGIREANKGTINEIKSGGVGRLPSSGGFAGLIRKSRFTTSVRTSGRSAGIRIQAKDSHDIKKLDTGQLRHPLFGNRKRWFTQGVRSGWFSEPIEKNLPQTRAGVEKVIRDTEAKFNN